METTTEVTYRVVVTYANCLGRTLIHPMPLAEALAVRDRMATSGDFHDMDRIEVVETTVVTTHKVMSH